MDLSSFSNPKEAVVTHLQWMLKVDFDRECLEGRVTYNVKKQSPDVTHVVLDTSHLEIVSVENFKGEPLSYTLHPIMQDKKHLGRKLEIELSESIKPETNTSSVTIQYRTTPQCSALQWLPPSQTAGKRYPYLFTQCQAIHARSLVPCQDRCGVKMTYRATVSVPKWATAVMSALLESIETDDVENTHKYIWDQPVPISSYLLALAVGELTKKSISPRCSLWSEPSVVEAAAWEFAQTEDFLVAAEAITGTPYVWGRYDLLCLPPSFPYGGMENPCLTFVTPTLLAGDRSLADVVAHEIAHSWTGNLVTNATWDHFWLNEGWTTWLQRKIMARIHNNPKFLDFDAIEGRKSLQDSVQHEMAPENTSLVLKIGDADPDDSYSIVAYEKGFTFLLYLERLMGTPKFEHFFQEYIARFETKTLTSEEFKDFFVDHFKDNDSINQIDWDVWLYGHGMPPVLPPLDQSMAQASTDMAEVWVTVDRERKALPTENEMTSWSSLQVVCFLDALQLETADKPLDVSTLQSMNGLYHFAESQNSEILFRYCQLAIASEDVSILPVVIRFITTQGRMKYVRPLYRSLYRSRFGRDLAVKTFLNNQEFYHPIALKMIAMDIKVARGGMERTATSIQRILAGLLPSSTITSLPTNPYALMGAAVVVGCVAVALLRKKQ